MWNYKNGGTMVCDKEEINFNFWVDTKQILDNLMAHKQKNNCDKVWFSYTGVFGGSQ